MTIRECDACGSRLAPDEAGERLTVNGGPAQGGYEYDVCDKCSPALFAMFCGQAWRLAGTVNSDSPDSQDTPEAKE